MKSIPSLFLVLAFTLLGSAVKIKLRETKDTSIHAAKDGEVLYDEGNLASFEESEDEPTSVINHFTDEGSDTSTSLPGSTSTKDKNSEMFQRTGQVDGDFDEFSRCMKIMHHNGIVGPVATFGFPATNGIPGVPGSQGQKGEPGSNCDCRQFAKEEQIDSFLPNVRQCAWNNYNFALSKGYVQTCSFTKRRRSSALRIEWHGSTRVKCNLGPCCSRWYFNIDGTECRDPQPIDGLVYLDNGNSTINVHRSMSVMGICKGISEGVHNITLWVGGCNGEYPRGQAKTGWNSSSRIIIEEISLQ